MTDPKLLAVLVDLMAEGDALDALVCDLGTDAWHRTTPAEGWDIATSVAHLAWTDEVAVAAATDKEAWDLLVLLAINDPEGFVDAEAARAAQVPPADLLRRWRAARRNLATVLGDYPAGQKMPWFGPPMGAVSMATARFMETWAHGLDVAEALGLEVTPHDRVRHVVHLGVRTRRFSYANRGLDPPDSEVYVALRAPTGGVWTYGPGDCEQQVTGSAWDFALLVTQRRHRADLDLQATGRGAQEWLDIAQAFAGPTGGGREPASVVETASAVEPVETRP